MASSNFDIIIIGTGTGGGTIAKSLSVSNKSILILERGDFIPKELENWDAVEVVEKGRYRTKEKWLDKDGSPFEPFTHYVVGGNSKVYGAAAFRLREKDFEEYQTPSGISPEWPLSYTDFKPYYDIAEEQMFVHGERGSDPTEPKSDKPYPYKSIPIEPFTKELYENVHKAGVKAFPIPMAVNLGEDDDAQLVLGNFDGFPDPTESKVDAHVYGVRMALKNKNVKLIKNALVTKLITNEQGNEVKQVQVEIDGQMEVFSADIVIVAGGAINSAALLLKSASSKHPNGLGNAFDLVGRNYMSHINGCLIAFTPHKLNLAPFQKYFCIGDYYWGDIDHPYPLGEIQLMGKNDPGTYTYFAPESLKGKDPKYISQHTIDFWLTSEDIPLHDNRVMLTKENQIQLIYHREKNNVASYELLKLKLKSIMEKVGKIDKDLQNITWDGYDLGISGVSHQCGTMKFGSKPENSVLDLNCKLHGVENLYVVDASFFVSCGAYNPSLTIAANSLRVADYIKTNLL